MQGRVDPGVEPPDELLFRLYERVRASRPDDPYLAEHAAATVVRTQAAVFEFYSAYLAGARRILDWGCRHAPDACLMRAKFGRDVRIDGCDFVEAGTFAAFHDFAGLEYRQLADPFRLPYDDGAFDAIVASGTLEHTAMDYESLKELYRVLKVDGRLVITYLPNRLSHDEWRLRRLRKPGAHRRLYGLDEATQLLKRTGFYPIFAGYQTRLDALPAKSLRHRVLRAVCYAVPLHRFSSTLCTIAEKVYSM